ncbi:DUF1700 domain-containing protein [Qiania dongpingensis]|uniref:DUF1700 domain-containing protein n=1 Tax=Qiania dongpingensis TaxID=2763669 RepID=A0A7G9G329_9FIRM|nr:DUF1700 domain-containing protein [Qiania dongpingensis]QNM05211.1 DUF1700 domain-containing protein [Qiania dongpingensis]
MNRAEYMKELAYLLQDVPDEEKEEALQYYEDYFDDAGVENEAQVISELGRPEKIAAIIREGARNGYENQDAEYTEAGYRNERYRSPQYEVVPPEHCRKDTIEDKNDSREESAYSQQEDYRDASYRRMEEETDQGEATWREGPQEHEDDSYHQTYREERQDRRPVRRRFSVLMWILVILGLLMVSPILLGGAGVAFGAAAVVVCGVGGVALAVILVAAVLLVVSVILIGIGIAKLLIYPIAGIMICGAGLVLLSIGMFFTWLSVLFCGKAVPGIIHMIGNFFNFLSRRLRRGGAAA